MNQHRSIMETNRRFQGRYGTRLAKKKGEWHAHGTIHNLNKGNLGKTKRVRTEANIEVLKIRINDFLKECYKY